jgi:hypothetical protein
MLEIDRRAVGRNYVHAVGTSQAVERHQEPDGFWSEVDELLRVGTVTLALNEPGDPSSSRAYAPL